MTVTSKEWASFVLAVAGFTGSFSCSKPPKTVDSDVPRRAVPIPACVSPLRARAESQQKFMRQLTDDQIWKLVFPTFGASTKGLGHDATLCTGAAAFTGPEFEGAKPLREWPFEPNPEDLKFGSGPKRIKIAWFRTHIWDGNRIGGVVALIRADEEFAEVYGIGSFKGSPTNSRFSTERIGGSLVVTAVDDGCAGKTLAEDCETWLHVMVPWQGKLAMQVSLPTERRLQMSTGEPSIVGPVNYRLTSSPRFEETKIRVLEQINAVDSTNRKLRTAELERQFDFVDGQFVERQRSLWDRVVGASPASDEAKPSLAGTLADDLSKQKSGSTNTAGAAGAPSNSGTATTTKTHSK